MVGVGVKAETEVSPPPRESCKGASVITPNIASQWCNLGLRCSRANYKNITINEHFTQKRKQHKGGFLSLALHK